MRVWTSTRPEPVPRSRTATRSGGAVVPSPKAKKRHCDRSEAPRALTTDDVTKGRPDWVATEVRRVEAPVATTTTSPSVRPGAAPPRKATQVLRRPSRSRTCWPLAVTEPPVPVMRSCSRRPPSSPLPSRASTSTERRVPTVGQARCTCAALTRVVQLWFVLRRSTPSQGSRWAGQDPLATVQPPLLALNSARTTAPERRSTRSRVASTAAVACAVSCAVRTPPEISALPP